MTQAAFKSKRSLVVAIDGPSGVGKTTVSRRLSELLELRYVDTGAMYRALALSAHEAGVDIESAEALEEFCSGVKIRYDTSSGHVFVNGKDFTGEIRSLSAGRLASIVSSKTPVRKFLVDYQRSLATGGSLVMEGRDIGTIVLPDADIKIFLDAPHAIRARRRHLELETELSSEQVSEEINARDVRDAGRADSPLRKADSAICIDTGSLDIDGVIKRILGCIEERFGLEDIRN
jgi:cytidylate kinase